jgi:hypothetical protein
MVMTTGEIRGEVERLSQRSAWPGCPGGWQYPFDLGHGIVTPAYGPVQATLHPWRRKVLLDNLDPIFSGRYDRISVLDLGACEGAMAAGLWERGVRDLTCVEARPINVEKARFVAAVKGYGYRIVEAEISEYLASETRTYDLVLFMGILYHLLHPFSISRRVAVCTRTLAVYETVLALPTKFTFDNPPEYRPTAAAFFVRAEPRQSNTAGLSDFELWPTRQALELLLKESGFSRTKELDYGCDPDPHFSSGRRTMYFAFKESAA